jgi:hypothetical protein
MPRARTKQGQTSEEVVRRHWEAARDPGKPWWEWARLCMCEACVRFRGEKLEQALAGP